MNPANPTGYLILADISGYTSYVARSEIENAQALLAELLSRIVDQFKPVLNLSRLEGDAVFAYTSQPISGETLLELIDATYIAFREGRDIYRSNLCDCEACQSLPSLDLKFIVHYGKFAIQKVSGFQELVGPDVNLAHRLLKNRVTEATGWRAYTLFSEAALDQINLQLNDLFVQTEAYEHLGSVKTYTINLVPRYQKFLEAKRVIVTEQDADLILGKETPLPPHEVWEWLTDPARRMVWEEVDKIESTQEQMGIGAQNRCLGENRAFVERVLDWKPFDYYSIVKIPQIVGGRKLPIETISTFKLDRTDGGGTRLQIYCKVNAPLPKRATQWIAKYVLRLMRTDKAFSNLANALSKADNQA